MDRVDLRYTVPDELLRRVLLMPVTTESKKTQILKGFAFGLSLVAMLLVLDWLAFQSKAFVPLGIGLILGSALISVTTRLCQRSVLRVHSDYNEGGGECRFAADANGILSARPGIESHLEWSLVQDIQQIDGAVLVILPAFRLILPDAAIPNGDKPAFIAQLLAWKSS